MVVRDRRFSSASWDCFSLEREGREFVMTSLELRVVAMVTWCVTCYAVGVK